jgi:signal transduction histidine kinase
MQFLQKGVLAMSLTRLAFETINNERKSIFAYLTNSAVLILIFNLMLKDIFIVYPVCVSLAILLVYLILKAIKLKAFCDNIDKVKAERDSDIRPDAFTEQKAFEVIKEIHQSYNERLNRLNEQLNGRNHFFSQFVHNMKSSAAIIELACDKKLDKALEDISLENEKLKKNLEQALNILRLDEFSNDYVPEKTDLSALLVSVINDKKRDFIYAGVYPRFEETEACVYTDKKWCAYILGQIVDNAVKYSNSGGNIYFRVEIDIDRTVLLIRDEGIGIPPEDLPRVFDLFFTGAAGRQKKEATGIGLAMVKYIAKKLGHTVLIESEPGKGTEVKIIFRHNS